MDELKIVKKEKVQPTPSVLEVLKRDYPIEASIADLIDNSIDAFARKVLIRFITKECKIESIEIIDDGFGINKKQIKNAMRFAYKRKYGVKDLGMYGVGLKVASLSHANTLTVFSRAKNTDIVGSQWTTDGILKEDWSLNEISKESVLKKVNDPIQSISIKKHGTIVRWDDIADFQRIQSGWEELLQKTKNKVTNYLGLKMHKLLMLRRIKIYIVTYDYKNKEYGIADEIKPLNPFPDKSYSATATYPKTFNARISKNQHLLLKGHIWRKKTKHEGYKLPHGKVAEHQGFYFFRNNRLITDGGWCDIIGNSEPHTSLARVEVHIPDKLSRVIKVQNNKARVDISPQVAAALFKAKASDGETLGDYIKNAEKIYRTKSKNKIQEMISPGKGFNTKIKRSIQDHGFKIKKAKNEFELKQTDKNVASYKINNDRKLVLFVPKTIIKDKSIHYLLTTLSYFAFERLFFKKSIKPAENIVSLINACLK
jgi:hypothetical protein